MIIEGFMYYEILQDGVMEVISEQWLVSVWETMRKLHIVFPVWK